MFQKSDANHLSELNVLSAALIIAFLAQTLQISTKSTAQFRSNSCLKNGTQKHRFPIWKIQISLLTARSVASIDVMLNRSQGPETSVL